MMMSDSEVNVVVVTVGRVAGKVTRVCAAVTIGYW